MSKEYFEFEGCIRKDPGFFSLTCPMAACDNGPNTGRRHIESNCLELSSDGEHRQRRLETAQAAAELGIGRVEGQPADEAFSLPLPAQLDAE